MPLNNKITRFIWYIIPWLLLILLVVTIVIMGIRISDKKKTVADEKASSQESRDESVNVVTQLITPGIMKDSIDLPALVNPWEDLMVKAEVDGKITAILVREGDRINAGQTLAEIDSRDYRNNLDSLLARQKNAQSNYDRLKKLSEKAAVSQAQLDDAHAALLDLNASLENTRLRLERCTVTSPISGVVNSLPARQGMLLAYGDPVAQILEIEKLKVDVAIPEADISAVRKITRAPITLAALNDMVVQGEKIFLSSSPASASMVYTLRLAVDNSEGGILPGMFARVNIVKETLDNAIGIPLYGVITQNKEQFVYVNENGIARKRSIKTGFLEGWKVLVTEGLHAGDEVVVVGHRSLEDGQSLRVVNTVTNADELNK